MPLFYWHKTSASLRILEINTKFDNYSELKHKQACNQEANNRSFFGKFKFYI